MSSDVPKVQHAAVITDAGPHAQVTMRDNVPVADPGVNEALVKLEYTGICASEIRAVRGWGAYNPIIGHEGVGIIVKLGKSVAPSLLNRRVGVKWLYSACGACSVCSNGHPNYCSKQLNTGKNVPGTLQQYVVADSRYVSLIPDSVPSEMAAPLLCAGLTMMGAVSRLGEEIQNGSWIVISGSGGGLGHIGVQIASRLRGLRVIAIDSGDDKRKLSLQSGADVFIDFRDEEDMGKAVEEITGEGAHGIIIVPGSPDAFRVAPSLVRNMGNIVCVGLPPNDFEIPISAALCSARGLTVRGAAVGTEEMMVELLERAKDGAIQPEVEVLGMSNIGTIISRLEAGHVTGRVVVRLPE